MTGAPGVDDHAGTEGDGAPVPADEPEGSAAAAEPSAPTPAAREEFSVVCVTGIEVELPAPHAVVVLAEVDEPHRSLAIPLGLPEATGLAHAWRGRPTPRPLTHELFADVLVRLGASVEVVRLLGRRAGVVLAELELSSPRGYERVPCRPSDALTLAIRQRVPAPVLVDPRLFDAEGDVEPEGR